LYDEPVTEHEELIRWLRTKLDLREALFRDWPGDRTPWGYSDGKDLTAWSPEVALAGVQSMRRLLDVFESDLRDDSTDETARHCIELLGLMFEFDSGYREEWRP
jgi:hypothetical protein